MSNETESYEPVFHIGLCMAGAVSAGAYTAGVMDYLQEALQEWQARKDKGMPETPSHRVSIPVIGGASAGGMTGIITGSAINNSRERIEMPDKGSLFAEHPGNKLYHSWVDLAASDMFPLLLDTADITKENGVRSLLNAKFINDIAERAIKVNEQKWSSQAPYWNDPLKIFTTLTNLEGFCYDVGFNANIADSKYFMTVHNDYACFSISEKGLYPPEVYWIPLNFKEEKNLSIARDAAMATGAFPIGLLARPLERDLQAVRSNPWLQKVAHGAPMAKEPATFKTLNVDGGLINNEPFDKVRSVLIDVTKQDSPADYENYERCTSTVLMIDPFPSEPPGKFTPDQNLFKVGGFTLSAMIDQMRAKPAHIVDAMDSNKAGQYLIAPSRRRPTLAGEEKEAQGSKAITCGAFDGFSGFINKEFRVHDFFLGRWNCEIFLREYFTIPAKAAMVNPIFRDGYKGIDMKPYLAKDGSYPIIPIFTPRSEFRMPVFSSGTNWPAIPAGSLKRFKPAINKRAAALLMNAMKLKWYQKALLWAGGKLLLNRLLTNKAINFISNALAQHELMQKED